MDLPCIAPASAPVPVPGMTYVWASKIGCALDCDLRRGHGLSGGRATDDAAKINAALAAASPEHPITLIIDGPALISGLFLPAGGYWNIVGLGCGTGFFIKSGTDNDGIHNGGSAAAVPSDPGPPALARGSSVSIRNLLINGNRGNGRTGVSTTGNVQGAGNTWYFPVNLMNLDNIEIQNVVVIDSPSFHMRFSNVGHVNISGCILRSQGINTDGFHFDGPANDIQITDCDMTTGDDAIALNCPEGYSGDINRVSVSNCKVNSGSFLVRFHPVDGKASFRISGVSVDSCTGDCAFGGFLVGHGSPSQPESISGVTISNCSLAAPAMLEIGSNFGDILIENCTLVERPSPQNPGFGFARSSSYSAGCGYIGHSLAIHDCVMEAHERPPFPPFTLDNSSSLDLLTFGGFTLKSSSSGAKTPAMLDIRSGELKHLVIDSVDPSAIQAAAPPGFSGVGLVSGFGVLATGWRFPDVVMADDVPYISASTGLPAIKVNGVVHPYP